MKEFRFRIIIVALSVLFGLYLLYPTFADYNNNRNIADQLAAYKDSVKQASPAISDDELGKLVIIKEELIKEADPSIAKDREKRVKLGLDLQGGMYLVMEVNTAKLIERVAKDPDKAFKDYLAQAEQESKRSELNVVNILAEKLKQNGIRLNRYFGTIRQEEAEIIAELEEQEKDAVSRAIEIIRNRVDQYGVSEPTIQKQGSRRIIVELPGIAREEEAKQLLQGRALLEFKLVKETEFTYPVMYRVDEVLARVLNPSDTVAVKDSTSEADTSAANLTDEEFAKKHPFFYLARPIEQSQYADAYVKESDKNKLMNYLNLPQVKDAIPDNVEFVLTAKAEIMGEGQKYHILYMVNKKPELTGGVIVDALANLDPSTGAPIVTMQMDTEGSRDWARITGANVGKRCAIVLDGLLYTAPVIRGKIPTGNSQIEGMADLNEAKLLEIVLKAGALPAPIDIIEERTVGPSLGQDSINAGVSSTLLALLLVTIFMIFYYKKAGTVADFALLFTIIFIMGILAGFQATLTLPGIAGMILTIGMAVDANVIIYERIREELSTGKTVKAAIESGFLNSYSAIFDSNITTFFTGIILYQFGSGPVQGFALTLMIGILASLFSALFITRLIFDMMASKGAKLNIG